MIYWVFCIIFKDARFGTHVAGSTFFANPWKLLTAEKIQSI
jgi:hypothetical protein